MDVWVRCEGSGDGEREMRDLLRWVRAEEIDGVGVRFAPATPAEGTMGALSEAIVIFGPGGVGAGVGAALMSWLQARRPGLTLEVTRPDGATTKITTSGTKLGDEALGRFLDDAFGSTDMPAGPRASGG